MFLEYILVPVLLNRSMQWLAVYEQIIPFQCLLFSPDATIIVVSLWKSILFIDSASEPLYQGLPITINTFYAFHLHTDQFLTPTSNFISSLYYYNLPGIPCHWFTTRIGCAITLEYIFDSCFEATLNWFTALVTY